MSFMRRDVNVGLLLLIVAALIMFSGFTVYYQTTFKNLSDTYQKELTELQRVTKDLESKRSLLNETSTQLQLRKQQEESLSKKFDETRDERNQLETDKKKLEVDLASTKAQLSSVNSQLTTVQGQLSLKNQEISQLNARISSLNSRIDNLEEEIECLEENSGNPSQC